MGKGWESPARDRRAVERLELHATHVLAETEGTSIQYLVAIVIAKVPPSSTWLRV